MSSWIRLFLRSDTAMASRATVIIGPSAFAPMPFLRSSGGVTSAMKTVFQTAGCRAARRPRRESCSGNPRRTRAAGCPRRAASYRARCRISVLFWIEYGVHFSEARPASTVPSAANSSTGAITFRLETPAARIAMISPSLAIRPKPDQDPDQHAERNGQRQHRRNGQREQRQDRLRAGVRRHQHFEQLVDPLQEDDERREQRAEQRAGQDLAKDVAAQQAEHGVLPCASASGGGTTGSFGSSSSIGCSSRSSIRIDGAITRPPP